MKIYLDVCCLNRPFDDQSQGRVRLEAEAVLSILKMADESQLDVVDSAIIEDELLQMPDGERRGKVELLVNTRRMKADTLNPAELRAAGCRALADALGPLGMARFLRQFERGSGDYTRERHQWLHDPSVQSVAARIRARRKRNA